MPIKKAHLINHVTNIFIETGTGPGGGILTALSCGFKVVHSIELNVKTYDAAKMLFIDKPQVHLYLGDSIDILPYILKELKEPCTFWLDAHVENKVQCEMFGKGKKNCPVLEELKIISEHPIKNHIILIDDFGVFRRGCSNWDNIRQPEIVKSVMEINPNYTITYERNGKILVAKEK